MLETAAFVYLFPLALAAVALNIWLLAKLAPLVFAAIKWLAVWVLLVAAAAAVILSVSAVYHGYL
jgi:hypothetical protein